MCARGPAPHVARGRKHCKRMASLYKHMGKLQRAVTLIVRCESKICPVKSLISTHSACPCKNYLPKYSQIPRLFNYLMIYINLFFFQGDHTLSRKIMPKNGCIVAPYNASRQPIHQFWSKWVMVATLLCARDPAPHVARGRETLQIHGFLYKHGKTSKGRNFNSKI